MSGGKGKAKFMIRRGKVVLRDGGGMGAAVRGGGMDEIVAITAADPCAPALRNAAPALTTASTSSADLPATSNAQDCNNKPAAPTR